MWRVPRFQITVQFAFAANIIVTLAVVSGTGVRPVVVRGSSSSLLFAGSPGRRESLIAGVPLEVAMGVPSAVVALSGSPSFS